MVREKNVIKNFKGTMLIEDEKMQKDEKSSLKKIRLVVRAFC